MEKTLSDPIFLPNIKGNMRLTVMAIHAVFLESGFAPCDQTCGSHSVSVKYTLPDLIVTRGDSKDVKNVILKFSSVGNHVSIYGCLLGAPLPSDIYRLSLDSSKLSPLLSSAASELTEIEKEDVFQLWRTVKDRLSVPLLIDICLKNGLPLPPCFTLLPTDLKIIILGLLPGVDLARISCTCSELRFLASNEELWKRKFLKEFGTFVEGSAGEFWKDKFAKLWVKRNRPRMERDNAPAQYILTPRIMPVPWIPGAWRVAMVGGDFDRFPVIGDRPSLWRARFNQRSTGSDFFPNCNFDDDGDL